VSHNIDYDARLSRAFYYLPARRWRPVWCVMVKSCTVFAWQRGKQKLTLQDNLNIWPMSLAKIGASLGLEKLDVDFDSVADEELYIYCRRDVEILIESWRTWIEFLDEHDLGNFGLTIAGQAWNAYRHKFMEHKIGIHNDKRALDLERESYRGARCETFRVGKLPPGTYYKLDVNGLYAAMMSFYPYPRKLLKTIVNVRIEYLDHLLHDHLIVARVLLDVHEPKYPVRIHGRNAYPTGTFFTTLTSPELQEALISGELVGVGRCALYEPADLFSGYVGWATGLRQQYKLADDQARSVMCKLLQNALQGKFGQRGHHQEIIGEAPLAQVRVKHYVDGETGRTCVDWTFGGRIIRQYDEGEPFDSFPAIPAHVSAYGRLYMWSLMLQAGRENVFYIDTDSLITNEAGYRRLANMISAVEPGKLKLESVASDVEIHAKKDYRFGEKRCIKGIRDNAELISAGLYDQWHFTTARFGFQAGNLDGVTLHRVQKNLSRTITAGTLRADGWIEPPRLQLTTEEIRRVVTGGDSSAAWTWELDQDWLSRRARADSLGRRLAAALQWRESPRAPDDFPLRLAGLASTSR